MAQTATLNVRMEPTVKLQLEQLCQEIGMSVSTAVNVFAKAAIRKRGMPFDVTAETDPLYSEENLRYFRQAMADRAAGINWHEHELIGADK